MQRPALIERWHAMMEESDAESRRNSLAQLLAEEAVFESPVVHTPQHGKALTLAYLSSASEVFSGGEFEYLNEWYGERSAVLEFRATIDDVEINGVDLIWWNEEQRIERFKVMVRPRKAMQLLHGMMAEQLERLASS